MGIRRKARIAAFQALYAWEDSHSEPSELISFGWLEKELDRQGYAFACLLISGTLEKIVDIDSLIKDHLKRWSFDRLAKVDLAILRTSVYALRYQTDIPASVTIDEAVEIAKSYGSPESYRFVNGVLDGIRKAALS